ncbi:MAG: metalloregulator ArsR/SmtB family transcription factor [Planctomycetota bacterium]|nr:metalloregulator ArsR/SmtB family transcription factor [Planctomycetota bacterium]
MSKRSSPLPRGCRRLDRLLDPPFFRALGDPNRLRLLTRLAGCCEPRTVTELSACCPVNISVVSRHLAILREAGIVDSERSGKEVRYRIRFDVLSRTFRQIADAIDDCCPSLPNEAAKRAADC